MNQNLRFKELRKKAKLTQEKLAELMGLQTPNYISQIETGKKKIGLSVINKFCKAIEMNIKEFFETEQKQVIKTKDTLTTELENLPTDKKNRIQKCVESMKNMDNEEIDDILKNIEKEKLWKKAKKTRRKTA